MHVLVTGAAGFIGSHLVRRLLCDGHAVTAVDDLSNGTRANLADVRGSGARARDGVALSFVRGDLRDPDLIDMLAAYGPDVVCHLAAQVSVRRSVADPPGDARTNVVGTINALEVAQRAGARKAVFASSVAVYGHPEVLPVPPAAATDPRSPYAASKLAGELYLHTYRELHGLDYTVLVLGNVYGPCQTPRGEAGVVAIFADAILRGQPTRIFGTGAQTRDYVYVSDAVDAFVRACGEQGSGQRINIGTGGQTSDAELHRKVAEAAGTAREPALDPPREGDLPAMAVDPGPAREILGWRPRTSLSEGVAATVDWHRAVLAA